MSVISLICSHVQMTDFSAKMHQIQFRLWLRPRPHSGSLKRSPDRLAGGEGLAAPSPRTQPRSRPFRACEPLYRPRISAPNPHERLTPPYD